MGYTWLEEDAKHVQWLPWVCLPDQDVIQWWIQHRGRSLMNKEVIAISFAHFMYEIWHVRNKIRVEG
ncbi:hypothetical protein KSS87_019089 [Heliosperma pusillum]|nr:hypothetical protein KSS87_019089 [Heliosperma pusillum]